MSGVPRGARLRLGDLRAQHDVAEQARAASAASSVPGRSSSIGKLSTSVGPGSSIHWTCSCLHGALVDEHDRELRVGMHVHRVEGVLGEPLQRRLVDLDGGQQYVDGTR